MFDRLCRFYCLFLGFFNRIWFFLDFSFLWLGWLYRCDRLRRNDKVSMEVVRHLGDCLRKLFKLDFYPVESFVDWIFLFLSVVVLFIVFFAVFRSIDDRCGKVVYLVGQGLDCIDKGLVGILVWLLFYSLFFDLRCRFLNGFSFYRFFSRLFFRL